MALRDRILPYAELLRTDPWGYPLVHHAGAFVVVLGADRRESGTHYTPKSLTEKIVEETLTPIVYRGPAEGAAREDWKLKSADELLDLKVCDPAMGSGAFLVQACRWLADRLVEAWSDLEATGGRIDDEGRIHAADDAAGFEPLSRDTEERAILARRLIAERCLYGVDKNPLAVELAKLSLWLTTLAKGRPFGFLDHNLRSGDSLLGIHDLGQLIELDMKPKGKAQLRLFGRTIRSAVDKALALRTQLRLIPIRDIGDVEAMAALDARSRNELALPELIADALVGIALADNRAVRVTALATMADEAAGSDVNARTRLLRQAKVDLALDAPDGMSRHPFHWPLEFPEVFLRENGGFDAFVGNPPFVGGRRIRSTAGASYNDYLVELHSGSGRNADLVVHFFRRGWTMLRPEGGSGFLATNSIAEGDSRQSGLEWLVRDGAVIYAAYPSEAWPGKAAVVTSRVHIRRGRWKGDRVLSGTTVSEISPFLTLGEQWSQVPLKRNQDLAFLGTLTVGMGFVLTNDDAARMIEEDPTNGEVLFPYLNGQDLNSSPSQSPSRYVINFWDWPEERAREYELPFKYIEENVKPERQRRKSNGDFALRRPLPQRWWQHGDKRPALYHAIGRGHHFENHPHDWSADQEPLGRIIAVTRVSKTLAFSFVPSDWIYSDATVVFASDKGATLAVLQSSIHAVFAWQHSSRLKNDLRYSPTDALEPFAFPTSSLSNSLEVLGNELDRSRREVMTDDDIGLTKLYGRFHSEDNNSNKVARLREIQREIDQALAITFGWDDLDLGHGFHEVPYLPENDRTRFTISEAARLDVLKRLSDLNRQRYQKEVEAGLHKAIKKQALGRKRTDQDEGDLFSADTAETEPVDG